ncbi:hypothetical protein VpasPP24_31 [Vibrio phage Vpas_PP24]|nr:hypothetical protein VpasPP24_31 [Vibrio phage Vpas_PP24]
MLELVLILCFFFFLYRESTRTSRTSWTLSPSDQDLLRERLALYSLEAKFDQLIVAGVPDNYISPFKNYVNRVKYHDGNTKDRLEIYKNIDKALSCYPVDRKALRHSEFNVEILSDCLLLLKDYALDAKGKNLLYLCFTSLHGNDFASKVDDFKTYITRG